MSADQRERCLRGWATSRLPQRRKAFQALNAPDHGHPLHHAGRCPRDRIPWTLGPRRDARKPIRPRRQSSATPHSLATSVIVGSGAGGGVVAAELAAAGKDVVGAGEGRLSERSGFHAPGGGRASKTMYDGGGLLATSDLGLVVLQGATLGGGTVINYTTSFPTPEPVAPPWAKEHNLPHFESAEFTRSLDAVARRIGITLITRSPSARDRCSSAASSNWDGITDCCRATYATARRTMRVATAAWGMPPRREANRP